MKLKNFLLIFKILLIFTINNIQAQLSNEECIQNLSIFAESAKVKNYEAAYEPWIKVRDECPSINLAIYSYGERILKFKYQNSLGEEKSSYANDILKLYDQWLEYFPTKKNKKVVGDIISSKAQAMIDYKIGDKMLIYSTFDKAFTTDPQSFTNPKGLYNYFKTLYDLYKEGGNEVTMEKLFDKYEEVSEKFEFEANKLSRNLDVILNKEETGSPLTSREIRSKKVYEVNSNAIAVMLKNLDAIIAKEATCENLIPLYNKNFEENKTDPIWLKRAASRMDNKECSDDQLFVTLVEALHNLDPSADSAIMSDEIFGPILPILSFTDLQEVIGFVNARPKPLALYIFANSGNVVDEVISQTSSGGICVNHSLLHYGVSDLGFGGVGDSGIGRYHGKSGFDQFSNMKSVLKKRFKPELSLLYPPYTEKKEKIYRKFV